MYWICCQWWVADFLQAVVDAFIRLEFQIIVEFHIQVEQRPSIGLIGESNASRPTTIEPVKAVWRNECRWRCIVAQSFISLLLLLLLVTRSQDESPLGNQKAFPTKCLPPCTTWWMLRVLKSTRSSPMLFFLSFLPSISSFPRTCFSSPTFSIDWLRFPFVRYALGYLILRFNWRK